MKKLTIKNPDGKTYRLPMRDGETMTIQTQMERAVYYGSIVDRLGEYEELGTPEEIREILKMVERKRTVVYKDFR